MQRRKLGHTDYEVAPIAFGGNVFGWTADEATSFALLDAFVAQGFNLIDTADSYSRWVEGHTGGESEATIGRWIARRGHHEDVVIATKVGSDMGLGYKCLKRDYVMRAAEDSLRRLGVEALDLYQSHWDDEHHAVRGNARGVLAAHAAREGEGDRRVEPQRRAPRAVARGEPQRRAAGLRNAAAALQPDRARVLRGAAAGLLRRGKASASFLTSRSRRAFSPASTVGEHDLHKSKRGPGLKKYLHTRGHAILAALDSVSHRMGATPAQIALAWLMTRPRGGRADRQCYESSRSSTTSWRRRA